MKSLPPNREAENSMLGKVPHTDTDTHIHIVHYWNKHTKIIKTPGFAKFGAWICSILYKVIPRNCRQLLACFWLVNRKTLKLTCQPLRVGNVWIGQDDTVRLNMLPVQILYLLLVWHIEHSLNQQIRNPSSIVHADHCIYNCRFLHVHLVRFLVTNMIMELKNIFC